VLKRNIEGVKREVFHMRTYEFVELHSCEEYVVDSLEGEVAERQSEFTAREEARRRLLEERRKRAETAMIEDVLRLLDFKPIPE
jgi:hypothetical protein